MVTFPAEVKRPFASTVNVPTCVALPYAPEVTPEAVREGFGYVPVRSPPALPPGATPEIVTLPAEVRRPFASTVNVPTCVALPYEPKVTPEVVRVGFG